MSGRKKHGMGEAHHAVEKDESEVRWLISYSDFMMQLVCLFILLYSVSNINATKAEEFVQSWSEHMGLEPVLTDDPEEGGKVPPLSTQDIPHIVHRLEVARGRLAQGQNLRVAPGSDGVLIRIPFEMFAEGSALIGVDGADALRSVASLLKPYRSRIREIEIVGHASAGERLRGGGSALRLSLDRARAALAILDDGAGTAFPHAVFSAGGRGDHDPVADGRDRRESGRNRRVDVYVGLIKTPKP